MGRYGMIRAKGEWHGVTVRECDDSMDCPRFVGIDGRGVTIVHVVAGGEAGCILAVRDREILWLSV